MINVNIILPFFHLVYCTDWIADIEISFTPGINPGVLYFLHVIEFSASIFNRDIGL